MKNLDWISTAVPAAIPAFVVLSLFLFKKWFLSPQPAQRVDWDSDRLYNRFRPISRRVWGGTFLIMPVFAFVTWFALSRSNQMVAMLDEPRAIHLLPQTAIWWFFPGFGALASSYGIALQILTLFIGRRATDMFNDWVNNTTRGWFHSRYIGTDSRRVLRWMMIGIALPIGVFVLLAVPMHANMGPDSVSRITEIAGFRDASGKLIRRAGLVLDFTDGRRWSSAEWGNWQTRIDPGLEDFIVKKTGVQPAFALTAKEIPPVAIDPTQP